MACSPIVLGKHTIKNKILFLSLQYVTLLAYYFQDLFKIVIALINGNKS
jgi:hypothetical protein